MSVDTWTGILGAVAGFCTTFAFVPQVVKIWRQGGHDLSYGMLLVYWTGVVLWLGYGLLMRAQAVIFANLASIILISFAIALKAWTAKRDKTRKMVREAKEEELQAVR
jgi:MtN3 and saliva related transmembrane protein